MRRFVLIGGSGFVGEYTILALKKRFPQNEIFVLDLVAPKEKCEYIWCDLNQGVNFDFKADDIVIHLAARQYHPKPPRKNREGYFEDLNYRGTQKVIEK